MGAILDGRLGMMPNDCTFVVGTEAGNAITTNIQLLNGATELDEAGFVFVYLSSDAAGQAPQAAQTSIACGTDGSVVGTLTAATTLLVVSEADGDIDIVVTDTGTYTRYLNVVFPNGLRKAVAMTFA